MYGEFYFMHSICLFSRRFKLPFVVRVSIETLALQLER